MRAYQQNRRVATGLYIAGSALLVSSFFVRNRNTKAGLAAGSVLVFSISIPITFRMTAHLNRAAWIHNRDMLIR